MKPEVEAKTEKLIGKYFRSANETNKVEWQGAVIAEPHPGWYLVQLFEWGSGAGNSLLHSLQEKAKALHPSPPPALTDKRTDTGQPSNLTPGA